MAQDSMTSNPQTQQTTLGPGKGTPVMVDVKAWREEVGGQKSGPVKYDLDWRFEGDKGSNKGDIVIPANTPATPIQFHFRDDTGLRLKFYGDAAEAMYVTADGQCPSAPGNGGQITFTSSSNNLLRVEDANSGDAVTLKYALRFDGDAYQYGGENYPPYVYDPDIRNGGGGVPPFVEQ